MRRLAAAMRDRAAKGYKFKKYWRKIGSVFGGCHACGEWEIAVSSSGKEWKRWLSGHDLYQSYDPRQTGGITFWCYECGAKDDAAWPNGHDRLGQQYTYTPPEFRKGWGGGKSGSTKKTVAPQPVNPRLEEVRKQIAEMRSLIDRLKGV